MTPTYTLEVILHSARNLPVSDLNSLSSDPYVQLSLFAPSQPLGHNDTVLAFRTPTVRRSRDAEWCPSLADAHCSTCLDRQTRSARKLAGDGGVSRSGDKRAPACGGSGRWVVGGAPRDGVVLKVRVCDEDPGNHDDALGTVTVTLSAEKLKEGIKGEIVEIKKRHAAPHVHAFTALAAVLPGVKVSTHPHIELTIRVLEETETEDGIRMYTLGPSKWSQHFSPLIGSITSSRHTPEMAADKSRTVKSNGGKLRSSVFIANKLQLCGPVPPELRHHFVGYTTIVKWLFRARGIIGFTLNHAAHKQYRTLYSYDKNTRYGVVDGGPADQVAGQLSDEDHRPGKGERRAASDVHGRELALRFLRMTSFGTGARLFTYVITLDGEWRFTETGEEFAVDLLSKHSMHADVAKEIAYSGEFFVRRVVHKPGGGFESAVKVEDGSIVKEVEEKEAKKKEAKEREKAGGGGKGDEKGGKEDGEGSKEKREESEAEDMGDKEHGKEESDEPHKPQEESHQASGDVNADTRAAPELESASSSGSGSEAPSSPSNTTENTDHTDHTQAYESDADHGSDSGDDADDVDTDEETIEDPSVYELVIDNDSGTYRPAVALLPVLRAWLADERRLGALGRVTAVDGFDEGLKAVKKERAAIRKRGKGVPVPEEEEEEEKKGGQPPPEKKGLGKVVDVVEQRREEVMEALGKDQSKAKGKSAPGRMALPKRGSSVSSIESGILGPGRRDSVSSREINQVLEEAAAKKEGQEGTTTLFTA